MTREMPRRPLWRRAVFWAFLIMLAILAVQRFPSEVSYWYLASAEIAAEQGDTEKAVQQTERAAAWTPHASLPWEMQSAVYRHAGNWDAAIQALDVALEKSPSEGLRHRRLYLLFDAGREKDVFASLGEDKEVVEAPQIQMEVAKVLTSRKQFDAALRILDKLEAQRVRDADLHLLKSHIFTETKRFEDALAEYNRATEIKPKLENEVMRLDLLLHLHRYDEVAQACREMEEKASFLTKQTGAIFNNGLAYFRAVANRDLASAEDQANRAVELTSGTDAMILDTRGFVRWRRGENEKALSDLDKAIQMLEADGNRLEQQRANAGLLRETSELTAQREQHLKTLAVVLYHRALAYQSLRRNDDAEKDLARVRELGFEPGDQLF
jgi:tetratricopeptide (TPR) repeat protein